MKRQITRAMRISLAVLLVLGSAFALQGMDARGLHADEAKLRIISVSGKGEVIAEPDIAYINLSVKTLNKDIKKAQEENAKLMNKVLQAIQAQKVDKKNIQTSDYSIHERYDWEKDREVFRGFEVRNSIIVKIKEVKKTGIILDKAIEAGANLTGGIRFDVENRKELYMEALKIAMKSAKGKADAILSTFGKKADLPYRVSEGFQEGYGRSYDMMNSIKEDAGEAKVGTGIEAGTMIISAEVSVDYAF